MNLIKKEWLKFLQVEDVNEVDELKNDDWKRISWKNGLPEDFIDFFADKLSWKIIAMRQKNLSEEFMERHFDKLNLITNFYFHIVSENFIEKHFDQFDKQTINIISACQKLSESFMAKHLDVLNGILLSQYQIISKNFLETNIDKLYPEYLLFNEGISLETFLFCKELTLAKYPKSIVFDRDILPLMSHNVFVDSFLKFFPNDEEILFSDIIEEYLSQKPREAYQLYMYRYFDMFNNFSLESMFE